MTATLAAALALALQVSAERLEKIDGIVAEAIARGETPGAVVVIARHGAPVYRKAFGARALEPAKEAMTLDTIFDLASLTKVVATATCILALVEDGALRLDDRVVRLLPEFAGVSAGGARDHVTIEQLLTHRGGFSADDPLDLYTGSPAEIFRRKHALPLAYEPGSRFVYSDSGFEVLGEVIRRVSGKPLDVFARERIFEPLGMADTGFLSRSVERTAPTERGVARGVVHDPRARALGGVAGHAGLFSTADDLAKYAAMILGGGAPVLSPASVAAMTRPRTGGDGAVRGLGWDIATGFSGARGDLFPIGSFGHTGFTGTSIWIDPASQTAVILLTNALHPDGRGNVLALRSKVASIAAAAILDAPASRAAHVLAGVDVLEKERFAPIAERTIALLTNATGKTRDGRSTIDLLSSEAAKTAGVKLVRLFSPEHGIRGAEDKKVSDSVDEKSGLPIRSLYGESRRPSPEDLAGLGAVVVDLQDAGCRFYTYLASVAYVMEEAAKARVAVVLLDRPNPIGADRAEGPLADADRSSFTSYHTLPIRTGLTIGECARLFDEERKLGADLTVVPMEGYARDLWYDETGLPWTNPSPNLRSVTQAALYPALALLEMTNVSVGRGTDSPFERFGAPWLDAARVAERLTERAIPGVRFTPLESTSVRITLVDRRALDAPRLGFEIATALRDLHPKEWDRSRFPLLLANRDAAERFERGESADQIAAAWAPDLEAFEARRRRFFLYPPSH